MCCKYGPKKTKKEKKSKRKEEKEEKTLVQSKQIVSTQMRGGRYAIPAVPLQPPFSTGPALGHQEAVRAPRAATTSPGSSVRYCKCRNFTA